LGIHPFAQILAQPIKSLRKLKWLPRKNLSFNYLPPKWKNLKPQVAFKEVSQEGVPHKYPPLLIPIMA